MYIPAYVPPYITPPKIQRSFIVNDITQGDEPVLETLESLCDKNKDHFEDGHMKGSFVSGYIFNLSKNFLSQTEINMLEKGSGFSLTPSFDNEVDSRMYFSEFIRKMRLKWYFRSENQGSKEILTLQSKSSWSPQKVLEHYNCF